MFFLTRLLEQLSLNVASNPETLSQAPKCLALYSAKVSVNFHFQSYCLFPACLSEVDAHPEVIVHLGEELFPAVTRVVILRREPNIVYL